MPGPRHGRWQAAAMTAATLAAMVAIGAASRFVPWPVPSQQRAAGLTRAAASPAAPATARASVAAGSAARAAAASKLAGARLRQFRLGAPSLRVPSSPVDVYLPAGYGAPANAGRAYPVVYLLHGYPADQSNWFTSAGLVAAVAGVKDPVIVVAPNVNADPIEGHDTECLDAVGGPHLETWLAVTLVAYIDRHFRTVASRAGRAIGGMSSGAFCALNVGLHHGDEFSVLLAQQPYGDPGQGPAARLLGGDPGLLRANSPIAYLPTVAIHRPLAVYLDAPASDRTARDNLSLLTAELGARQVEVQASVLTGAGHGWAAARAGLPGVLAFAAAHLHPATGAGPRLSRAPS
jgi:S-formylglutathione hydrolase FrmB